MSDCWKAVFEFYIKRYENGCSSSILLKYATVSYLSAKRLKYSNCTVTSSKRFEENQDTFLSSLPCTLNSLLSGLDAIITAHDFMQNPSQNRIFYEPGQICLTQTKCYSVDTDNPYDPTQFQPRLINTYSTLKYFW